MEVTRNGSQPAKIGGDGNFTGHALRTPLFGAHAPSRMVGGAVTFEAGARTVWHTHPVGQILIITMGSGKVQSWDGPVVDVGPGDVVWFAPGEKHWHGASPTSGMSHIAIVEQEKGETTTWLEPVTQTQYTG
jgi:quercetin dioxygenase-like cupin family protein